MIKGQKVKENNMSNYVISCCSTADLTREHMLERNIRYAAVAGRFPDTFPL